MPSPPSRRSAPPPPFRLSSPPPPASQSLPPPPLSVSADGVPGIGFHGKTTVTEPTSISFAIVLIILLLHSCRPSCAGASPRGEATATLPSIGGLWCIPVVGRSDRRFSGLLPGEQVGPARHTDSRGPHVDDARGRALAFSRGGAGFVGPRTAAPTGVSCVKARTSWRRPRARRPRGWSSPGWRRHWC